MLSVDWENDHGWRDLLPDRLETLSVVLAHRFFAEDAPVHTPGVTPHDQAGRQYCRPASSFHEPVSVDHHRIGQHAEALDDRDVVCGFVGLGFEASCARFRSTQFPITILVVLLEIDRVAALE